MLQLTELKKQYATGELALKGVTLEIPRGQVLALIGPSGAGKSTLIRCINRLVQPTSGNVRLNDQELTKLSSRALRRARRKIGMIFQEYALVERSTVMENVLSGRLATLVFGGVISENFRRLMYKKLIACSTELVSSTWLINAQMNSLEVSGRG